MTVARQPEVGAGPPHHEVSRSCGSSSQGGQPTALRTISNRSLFLSTLKIHRPRSDLNPQPLRPGASTQPVDHTRVTGDNLNMLTIS